MLSPESRSSGRRRQSFAEAQFARCRWLVLHAIGELAAKSFRAQQLDDGAHVFGAGDDHDLFDAAPGV